MLYTVINKNTGQEIRSHNAFRIGSLNPNIIIGENEKVVLVPNTLIAQLKTAYECTITANTQGTATAITVTKTMEEWEAEQPPSSEPTAVTSSTIEIMRKTEATEPAEVTVTDMTDYWAIKATRNVTSAVISEVTYYTYEYVEIIVVKDARTQSEIEAITLARENELFSDTEYPALNLYKSTTNSTDLIKLIFALIDQNKTLSTNIATLQGNITTINGSITTLQGNISTINSSITSLDSRITMLEGGA